MTTQCNLTQYEATMFFESTSTTDGNYEDDFWFAGYCLATDFQPTPTAKDYGAEDLNLLLTVYSIDSRIGF